MKSLIALLLAFAAAVPVVHAQDAEITERARIKSEREAAEARFKEQQRACRATFAVTDCIEKAQRERNATIAELRRQERVLSDEDRRRRAAERQKDLDERTSPEARVRAEEKRKEAVKEQQDREERAAEKARKRQEDEARRAGRGPRQAREASGPPGPQGRPRAEHQPQQHGPSPEEAARNRATYEERLKEAETRRARLRERVAKQKKAAASDLPVPP
jgi:colicin import membrane protein